MNNAIMLSFESETDARAVLAMITQLLSHVANTGINNGDMQALSAFCMDGDGSDGAVRAVYDAFMTEVGARAETTPAPALSDNVIPFPTTVQ